MELHCFFLVQDLYNPFFDHAYPLVQLGRRYELLLLNNRHATLPTLNGRLSEIDEAGNHIEGFEPAASNDHLPLFFRDAVDGREVIGRGGR
jgi:hypothetical protein